MTLHPTARLIEICSAKAMFPTWPGVRMRKSGLLSPSLPYRCPVSVGLSIRLATTALGPSVVLYTDFKIKLKFMPGMIYWIFFTRAGLWSLRSSSQFSLMCWQIGQTEKLQAHNSLPSDGKTYKGIFQTKRGGCCQTFQKIILGWIVVNLPKLWLFLGKVQHVAVESHFWNTVGSINILLEKLEVQQKYQIKETNCPPTQRPVGSQT